MSHLPDDRMECGHQYRSMDSCYLCVDCLNAKEAEFAEYKSVAEKLDNLQMRQRDEIAELRQALDTAHKLFGSECDKFREQLRVMQEALQRIATLEADYDIGLKL